MKTRKQIQRVADASDLRKWRIELPNLYDDADLTPYEFRLLVHYKRVGNCWEGTRRTAAKCHMSIGQVVASRKSLATKRLIRIGDLSNFGSLTITVTDVWARNFSRYSKRSHSEHPRSHSEHPVQEVNASVHRVNERSNPIRRNSSRKEPIEASSSANQPSLVARKAELMMMYLGIDRTVAQDLAQLDHVSEEYVQDWIRFCENDETRKVEAQHYDQVLGAGFYVDRIKRGLYPQHFGSAKAGVI